MPVGVVGCITPWNFPIAIPAWKITAALICGNTIVFKPSSDTPLCAAAFVEILNEAGVPPGVLNMVTGNGEEIGNSIVASKKVRGISFTGHRSTGEQILKKAGVKRVGLELGGKNPIIVMDDADLNLALDGIIWGAFGTTGQRCSAASRVIMHKSIRKKLENAIVERARKLRIGYGMQKGVEMGPLVNEAAVKKSEKYCGIGVNEGARLLCGGLRPRMNGHFFMPTVFTDVEPDMRIFQEEIFGPVLSVIETSDIDEAIEMANKVEYGLTSSIYTRDVNKAFKAIARIEAGLTYVNSSTIGSEAHLPFGGVKGTGNGTREGGMGGIEEFSEIKTVYVDYSGKLQRAQIDTG
jgi:aldehyde dehydrogenase (NAD+)